MRVDKAALRMAIIDRLSMDLQVLYRAARNAHEAATHVENAPDNKYDTLALEASYVAQGQANRASQIRLSIEAYRQMELPVETDIVRMGSLVVLEDGEGTERILFIGPLEGGMMIEQGGAEIVVITPVSPMGRGLLGKCNGESVEIEAGNSLLDYEIVAIC